MTSNVKEDSSSKTNTRMELLDLATATYSSISNSFTDKLSDIDCTHKKGVV